MRALWIEISWGFRKIRSEWSRPVRALWIEMVQRIWKNIVSYVEAREGLVD